MKRRAFLKKMITGATGLAVGGHVSFSGGCGPHVRRGRSAKKVIVLGIDGMDPVLLKRFVGEGAMPNFQHLMEHGDFRSLGTSLPPQSPVAWSSFITGTNPGGHGIYDFIHRDPVTFLPYLSTSRIQPPSKSLAIGDWDIPLTGGKTEMLRKGPAFWSILEDHGIPATIFRMPANFPPVKGESRTISGLGTPDLLGTYGTFSYYTDAPPENADDFSGGVVYPVQVVDNVLKTELVGPVNTFRRDRPNTTVEFTVYPDPVRPVAKIVLPEREMILNQGEWSPWMHVRFDMLPHLHAVSGICRFYLQQVHPHFKLYVSPLNIDPTEPALPISTPGAYSKELAEAIGPFHTQGFPEETKALSNGIFSDEEYLEQADYVLQERMRQFEYELNRFSEGFLFFYFSSIDQNSHMMLRTMDVNHHLYEKEASPKVKGAVKQYYQAMDTALGRTRGKVDSHTTLLVLSDHGFAPFYREFHLSSWLLENGYTALRDPSRRGQGEFFENVDWSRTQVYALGLNGVYINMRGRESHGSVDPSRAKELKEKIKAELEAYEDPATGQSVVRRAYDPKDVYSGPYVDQSPDLIVGYRRGYRISDQAVLGTFPERIIEDRKDKWSADHCIDPPAVPGVLLTNTKIELPRPSLQDIAPTILGEFDLPSPREMTGRSVFVNQGTGVRAES